MTRLDKFKCTLGEHVIAPSVLDELKRMPPEKRPTELIVQCSDDNCNSFVRLVKEYNDRYFILDMGKRRSGEFKE